MVEYHGWLTLHDDTPEDDRIWEINREVRAKIAEMDADNRILGMKVVNGSHMAWFAGLTNHRSADIEEVFDLLDFVARRAPGSFGLLYLWDDAEHENEFRVWRLAKGKLTEHRDELLSPCIPTIEEPEVAVMNASFQESIEAKGS